MAINVEAPGHNRVRNLRRYCLLQAYDADLRLDFGVGLALRDKQRAQPGSPLPEAFPFRVRIAKYYQCAEDLDGADSTELQRIAGLTRAEAEAVLAAAEIL